MSAAPLMRIPVGVVVERAKAASQWVDYIWRPVSVLPGQPDTTPWTMLDGDAARATFYAGPAIVELHRSETANYRDNLSSGAPSLWVVLRETGEAMPYALYLVTADPSEGEGMTAAGNNLVEAVPMPDVVRDAVAAFVAEHHVAEEVFVKRKRDRVDPEALGRRGQVGRRDEQ